MDSVDMHPPFIEDQADPTGDPASSSEKGINGILPSDDRANLRMDTGSDARSQAQPATVGGQPVNEDAVAKQPEAAPLEELLEADFEVWLRHFGAC